MVGEAADERVGTASVCVLLAGAIGAGAPMAAVGEAKPARWNSFAWVDASSTAAGEMERGPSMSAGRGAASGATGDEIELELEREGKGDSEGEG